MEHREHLPLTPRGLADMKLFEQILPSMLFAPAVIWGCWLGFLASRPSQQPLGQTSMHRAKFIGRIGWRRPDAAYPHFFEWNNLGYFQLPRIPTRSPLPNPSTKIHEYRQPNKRLARVHRKSGGILIGFLMAKQRFCKPLGHPTHKYLLG